MGVGEFPAGYAETYAKLAAERKPRKCLEIGTETGKSAVALLETVPQARLWSVDIAPCEEARGRIEELGFSHRWTFVQGDSRDVVPGIKGTFDWAYVDGDHSYEVTYEDLQNAWAKLKPSGVMVVDDYGVGIVPGVRQAVDEFAASVEVTLYPLPDHPHGAVYFVKGKEALNGNALHHSH